MLIISDKIKKIYPEALLGILVMKNVCNPKKHEELKNVRGTVLLTMWKN